MSSGTKVVENDPVIASASQPASNSRVTCEIDLVDSRYASRSVSPKAQDATDAMAAQHGLALADARKGDLPQVSLVVV